MLVRASKAIILNPSGDVLIVRRSSTHPYVPLTDDIPGGKVEEGETMLEGLSRELSEETGIVLSDASVRKLGSNHAANYFGNDYEIELYEVKLHSDPTIVLDYEHDMFRWIPLKDAKILGELYEPMFNSYKEKATKQV